MFDVRNRRLYGGLLTAALAAGVLTFGSTSASAKSPWRAPAESDSPRGSKVAACVKEAEVRRPSAWTCMGGQLSISTQDASGKVSVERIDVVDNTPVDTTGEVSAASHSDDDTWCESGTICTERVNGSNYIVVVKGNGAYGNQSGAIGAFDQVMRQSFNGGNPRWRMTLIHDAGPAVNGNNFHTRCRKSDAFSDSVCGDNPYDPATISSASRKTWFPSSTGYVVNSQILSGSTNKYHDENYGAFTASGYTQTWSTGTIHTGRWNKCGACIYYQVPWTTSP